MQTGIQAIHHADSLISDPMRTYSVHYPEHTIIQSIFQGFSGLGSIHGCCHKQFGTGAGSECRKLLGIVIIIKFECCWTLSLNSHSQHLCHYWLPVSQASYLRFGALALLISNARICLLNVVSATPQLDWSTWVDSLYSHDVAAGAELLVVQTLSKNLTVLISKIAIVPLRYSAHWTPAREVMLFFSPLGPHIHSHVLSFASHPIGVFKHHNKLCLDSADTK